MFIYDADDIRQAESFAIKELGAPSIILMENAARGVANAVKRRFLQARNILVACGVGNNGGDGAAAARLLMDMGRDVRILLVAPQEKCSEDLKINLELFHKLGGKTIMTPLLSDRELISLLHGADLVIDALLGTGSSGAPRGEVLRVIRSMNGTVPVVSIDIPSGVDPSTGETEGEAVKAALTVTLLARKAGLEIMPGRACRGDIETVDLGIPPDLVLKPRSAYELLGSEDISSFLPKIGPGIHKGDRGTVLVIGGSERYRGAPVLSALGALRAGAGCVLAAVPTSSIAMFSPYPEMILLEAESDNGCMTPLNWDRIMEKWGGRFNSVVIGPGLDRGKPSRALFRKVWNEWNGTLCVDGDALYALSEPPEFGARHGLTMITPHEGEAAVLLARTRDQVGAARLRSAVELSALFGAILLKGPGSLVSDGSRIGIMPFVVPGLSVPGSGDVLAGIIGAFSAAGLGTFEAIAAGAYVHGLAGKMLQNRKGFDGIIAREIANAVPFAISRLRSRKNKGEPFR